MQCFQRGRVPLEVISCCGFLQCWHLSENIVPHSAEEKLQLSLKPSLHRTSHAQKGSCFAVFPRRATRQLVAYVFLQKCNKLIQCSALIKSNFSSCQTWSTICSHTCRSFSKHAFNFVKTSLPVPFTDCMAVSSSVILKSAVIPRTKTSSWAVSRAAQL